MGLRNSIAKAAAAGALIAIPALGLPALAQADTVCTDAQGTICFVMPSTYSTSPVGNDFTSDTSTDDMGIGDTGGGGGG